MAKNQRTFADGINEMNGYVINVIRFVGAQQISNTSRIAAHYWGTITKPDGTEISMGDNGMTVTDIKKIVSGMATRTYNRSGESSEIKKLEQIKAQMSALGIDTAEVDAKIEQIKAEQEAQLEADKLSIENQKRVKQIQKEIKKLDKLVSQTESLGVNADSIKAKIASMYADIESIMDGNPID